MKTYLANLKKCLIVSLAVFLVTGDTCYSSAQNRAEKTRSLIQTLKDNTKSDRERFRSIFALAKLNGKKSIPLLRKYFSHPNWMIRDAALKAAAALNAFELREDFEKRLRDNALVIRTTAVDAIGHLKLKKSFPKLVEALFDPANYNSGKPLWIHSHIFSVLAANQYRPATPKLVELLKTHKDQKFRKQIVSTLEKITGKSFPNRSISEQVFLWHQNVVSEMTF